MKIVEIIGPSGVGKTTLKHTLLQARLHGSFKLFDQRAFALHALRPQFVSVALQWLAHTRLTPVRFSALSAAEALNTRFRNVALRNQWDSEWSEFMTLTMEYLASAECFGNVMAARVALMVDSIAQAHYARYLLKPNTIALFDEGILQRGITIAQTLQGFQSDRIKHYFEVCPAPDCAIIITADIATVEGRLRGRRNFSQSHLQDTSFAIHATQICRQIFEERSIPMLLIDSSDNKFVESTLVIDFINNISML